VWSKGVLIRYVDGELEEAASSVGDPISRAPSFFAAERSPFVVAWGVDGQRESWLGVSESGMCGFGVDSFDDHDR